MFQKVFSGTDLKKSCVVTTPAEDIQTYLAYSEAVVMLASGPKGLVGPLEIPERSEFDLKLRLDTLKGSSKES